MGSLLPPELSLDVRPTFVPKTIGDFLREVSAIGDASRRSSRLEDLVKNLEEEMRKIDAFKRELPLCMLLLQDAIITLKMELVRCTAPPNQPVLAELMPLKKCSDEIENEDTENDAEDKKNWKSCLQLWTNSSVNNSPTVTAAQSFDLKLQEPRAETTKGNELHAATEDVLLQKCKSRNHRVSEFMPLRRAFSPPPATIFPRKENNEVEMELPVNGLSLLTPAAAAAAAGGCKSSSSKERTVSSAEMRPNNSIRPVSLNFQPNLRSGSHQQTSRKQRRCWSPELHRRFINALQKLGGSQAATPKQIRELMQVDGLTNDEVKSHLQKYRLHTRRYQGGASAASPTKQSESSVVLGGLWPSQNKTDDSAKGIDPSGSPEGPLQLCASAGAPSTTGGDSMEDDEDSRSESFSWKNHIHRPRPIGV